MSLRRMTLFLILAATAGLMGVVLINNTRILQGNFEQQEKNSVYLNLQQVKNAIAAQIEFMDKTSNDWANWDDTYNYVQTGDPAYVEANLQPITFQNLGINLFILVNERLEVVYSGMVSQDGQFSAATPAEINANLVPDHLFPADPNDTGIKHGLILLSGQPMMIISHPVLRSDNSGPARGTLLLGKFIDQGVIEKIDNLLSVSIQIDAIASAPKNAAYAAALAYRPSSKDPYYVDLKDSEVSGYARLEDIFGNPVLILRLTRFPAIYNSGLLVNNYLIISVVMISITFGILLFLLIEFNVLARIRQLSSAVQAIGVSGDINRRLADKRNDELSALGAKINAMLDALERANAQRRESEERFRTLVESMEEMVFTIEGAERRIHLYEAQRSPDSSGQARQASLLPDLERELQNHPDLLEQVFQGRSASLEWSSQADGNPHNFALTLSPIYSGQHTVARLVGVSKEVTSYKNLEQDLRMRLGELNALLNASQQLLSEIEEVNIYDVICRVAVEQLGMDAAWVVVPSADGGALLPAGACGLERSGLAEVGLTRGGTRSFHPAGSAFNLKEMVFFSSAHASQPGEEDAVAIPLLKGGTVLAVLVLVRREAPGIRAQGQAILQSYINLASIAAQNAQLFKQILSGRERLQSLSRRMVEIQEQERREIALELHDEIGQILTGLHFSVEMIQTMPPEKVKDAAGGTLEIINELIGQVRQMSLSLRPSMLDDLGIVPTLIWYFERYTAQTAIQVDFRPNNLIGQRFGPNVEITAFRVVQEALTNVARYAMVQAVSVRLWSTENILGIQVEDEGVGFDQDLVFNSHDSKGLLGMRERVGFLGGRLTIITQPGEGTSLTAEIPLQGYLERRQRDSADRISG